MCIRIHDFTGNNLKRILFQEEKCFKRSSSLTSVVEEAH